MPPNTTTGATNDAPSTRLYPRARLVLHLLERNVWTCGVEFLEAGAGWSFSTRISDVRLAGYPVAKRRCLRHSHRSAAYEYALGDE